MRVRQIVILSAVVLLFIVPTTVGRAITVLPPEAMAEVSGRMPPWGDCGFDGDPECYDTSTYCIPECAPSGDICEAYKDREFNEMGRCVTGEHQCWGWSLGDSAENGYHCCKKRYCNGVTPHCQTCSGCGDNPWRDCTQGYTACYELCD